MLVHFKVGVTNPTISYHHEVPGYSGCQTEPPSLHLPVSTKSRTGLRFREGEEDPVLHGQCSMPVRVTYGIGGCSVTVIPRFPTSIHRSIEMNPVRIITRSVPYLVAVWFRCLVLRCVRCSTSGRIP